MYSLFLTFFQAHILSCCRSAEHSTFKFLLHAKSWACSSFVFSLVTFWISTVLSLAIRKASRPLQAPNDIQTYKACTWCSCFSALISTTRLQRFTTDLPISLKTSRLQCDLLSRKSPGQKFGLRIQQRQQHLKWHQSPTTNTPSASNVFPTPRILQPPQIAPDKSGSGFRPKQEQGRKRHNYHDNQGSW